MKITKLKSGYRISLSDGEFEALAYMVDLASADLEGTERWEWGDLSRGAVRALKSGRLSSFGPMAVDEDRRQAG